MKFGVLIDYKIPLNYVGGVVFKSIIIRNSVGLKFWDYML
jgi:hypothetical protein